MKALSECRILVTPTSFGVHDPAIKMDLEKQVKEVVYNTTGKPLRSDQLGELLEGVDGMIAGLDEIDRAALQRAGNLRVIARYGVGTDNVDLQAAAELGIAVTNTPGANAGSVAELAVGLILVLLRGIYPAVRSTKEGGWPRTKGFSLEGKTVGILGCGAIGKETARRLGGFGCTLLACDECPDEDFARQTGVAYGQLEDILPRADIISLHLPVTAETSGLVNREFLGQMKAGSWLVNTARGELIEEGALYESLQSGHLRGAALDVYSSEPPDLSAPLYSLDQVVTTPHIGGTGDSAANSMGRIAVAECLAVLQGEKPRYQVN